MIAPATHRIALVAFGGASWMLAGHAVADPLVGVRSGRPAKLIAESVAESVGMTRAWFTQAALDPTQDEVVGAAVDDDAVYLLASTGTLQAIDRHTGATRWSSRLDPTGSPPFGPSVRAGRVAAVVGAVLHVVDARDGKPAVVDEETGRRVESRRLEAAPGAAPAIGETHVYVPASNGSLMVLAIDPEESLPLRVASPGELMVRPVVTDNRVVWSTMAGDVYSVPLDGRGESVRVEDAGVVAGPALAVGERIMLVSRVGELVAKQAKNGRRVWRGSLGERAAGSGAMVDGVAYVPARGGSMHAVDFETGREQWVAPGVAAVVAVSGEQVYAIDSRGSLVLLDRADGRLLGAVPGVTGLTAVTNPIDDRVYLVSSDGLIQSLHEATLSEPRRHDGAVAEGPAEDPAEDSPEAVDAPAAPVDDEPSPFDEEPAEESPLDDPFGDPAAADDAGDDPFGDDPFADF